MTLFCCEPGSSVGVATELLSGRSAIESLWVRDFPPVQTGPGAHPASYTMSTKSFPGAKCGRGVGLTSHPHLVPKILEKSRSIPLLTLRACVTYKKRVRTYLHFLQFPCGSNNRSHYCRNFVLTTRVLLRVCISKFSVSNCPN